MRTGKHNRLGGEKEGTSGCGPVMEGGPAHIEVGLVVSNRHELSQNLLESDHGQSHRVTTLNSYSRSHC
jgi:hypothetical protein